MLCRSITDAARMLGVSQPTLTKVLRHAEDQLGFRLFRRERGRLQPTEEAQLLFADADRIFRELQSLQRLSTDLKEGTGGLLRVGATASLALTVVPDALELYRREFPGVRIMSYLLAGNEMSEMVVAPSSISAFRSHQSRCHRRARKRSIGVICIMPENHPLAALDVVTPHEIADHTLISYSGATPVGQMLEGAFRRAGMRRRVDIEVSLSPLACTLVQRGVGVALVDGFVPRLALRGIVWRKFRPQMVQQVNLVTPLSPSHFASNFVIHLRRVVSLPCDRVVGT